MWIRGGSNQKHKLGYMQCQALQLHHADCIFFCVYFYRSSDADLKNEKIYKHLLSVFHSILSYMISDAWFLEYQISKVYFHDKYRCSATETSHWSLDIPKPQMECARRTWLACEHCLQGEKHRWHRLGAVPVLVCSSTSTSDHDSDADPNKIHSQQTHLIFNR